MSQEIPIILEYYDLSLLLLKRVALFPRNLRHGLGRSIEFRVETLLSLLIRAKYSPRAEKDAILRDANIELEILRFQIRQAVELKGLALRNQQAIIEKLIGVGQQIGGWRKSLGKVHAEESENP